MILIIPQIAFNGDDFCHEMTACQWSVVRGRGYRIVNSVAARYGTWLYLMNTSMRTV
jgi:hypothetical protein